MILNIIMYLCTYLMIQISLMAYLHIKLIRIKRTKHMSTKIKGIYKKGIKQRIGRFFEKVHECILIFTDWLG